MVNTSATSSTVLNMTNDGLSRNSYFNNSRKSKSHGSECSAPLQSILKKSKNSVTNLNLSNVASTSKEVLPKATKSKKSSSPSICGIKSNLCTIQ